MPITAKSLSAQAMRIAPEERLARVDELLGTLDVPDASLDVFWGKEADSRLAAYRRDEIPAASLSDVSAKYPARPGLLPLFNHQAKMPE